MGQQDHATNYQSSYPENVPTHFPPRVSVLGCPVDNFSLEETLVSIDEIIRRRCPSQHVVVNVDKLLKARRDPEFAHIISSCAIINPDGMPVVWASRLLGVPLKERIAGIDLMQKLIEHSSQKRYKVYFLGAREEVIIRLVARYQQQYPDLQIAGYSNGYWDASQEEDIVRNIADSQADILFVGISSPKKEFFLNQYIKKLQVPFVMGVGGSFDVVAGGISRAPRWMQDMGFEWTFRLWQEPGRLWRRYLIGNFIFLLLLCKDIVKVRILGKNKREDILHDKKRA